MSNVGCANFVSSTGSWLGGVAVVQGLVRTSHVIRCRCTCLVFNKEWKTLKAY